MASGWKELHWKRWSPSLPCTTMSPACTLNWNPEPQRPWLSNLGDLGSKNVVLQAAEMDNPAEMEVYLKLEKKTRRCGSKYRIHDVPKWGKVDLGRWLVRWWGSHTSIHPFERTLMGHLVFTIHSCWTCLQNFPETNSETRERWPPRREGLNRGHWNGWIAENQLPLEKDDLCIFWAWWVW